MRRATFHRADPDIIVSACWALDDDAGVQPFHVIIAQPPASRIVDDERGISLCNNGDIKRQNAGLVIQINIGERIVNPAGAISTKTFPL